MATEETKEKTVQAFEIDELLYILYDKIMSKVELGGLLKTLESLSIKKSAFYDLKSYVEKKEIRESRDVPLGITSIKQMSKALGIEFVCTMYCVKI